MSMKTLSTSGKRMQHLIENVLRVSQEDFCRLSGASRTSIVSIKNDEGGKRTLEEIVERLNLNPQWVYNGKGSIWLSGTDEENITRIKAANKPAEDSTAIVELKTELNRYREREDRLQRIIDRLLSGGSANFRKALGNQPLAEVG